MLQSATAHCITAQIIHIYIYVHTHIRYLHIRERSRNFAWSTICRHFPLSMFALSSTLQYSQTLSSTLNQLPGLPVLLFSWWIARNSLELSPLPSARVHIPRSIDSACLYKYNIKYIRFPVKLVQFPVISIKKFTNFPISSHYSLEIFFTKDAVFF